MTDDRAHFIKAHNEYLTPPSTYAEYMECPNCGGEGGMADGMCMVCNGYGAATEAQIDERWDGTYNGPDMESE